MAVVLFLLTAAAYDYKYREIPGWIYAVGGTEAFIWRMADMIQRGNWMEKKTWMIVFHGNNLSVSFDEIVLGILIGAVLLAVSKVTGGAVGMGDGLLFTITGLYFGFQKNLILLLGSLVLCSIWGIGSLAIKRTGWLEGKKTEVPFLPFVLPVGIWITFI